jgi:hypothetical protein
LQSNRVKSVRLLFNLKNMQEETVTSKKLKEQMDSLKWERDSHQPYTSEQTMLIKKISDAFLLTNTQMNYRKLMGLLKEAQNIQL